MEEEPEEAEVGGGRRFTDELKAVYGERRSEILYSKYSTVGGLRKRDGERATNERTDASANSAPALSLSLSLGRRGRRRHPLALAAPAAAFVGARTFDNVL